MRSFISCLVIGSSTTTHEKITCTAARRLWQALALKQKSLLLAGALAMSAVLKMRESLTRCAWRLISLLVACFGYTHAYSLRAISGIPAMLRVGTQEQGVS